MQPHCTSLKESAMAFDGKAALPADESPRALKDPGGGASKLYLNAVASSMRFKAKTDSSPPRRFVSRHLHLDH
jgi:hypothetical protein